MVHQPLAHTRHMRDDLDPEIAQVTGRPNASAQQMRGRVDRARRNDHFAAAELGILAVDQGLYADATLPLENELLDLGQSRDRQVAAQPRAGIEIADCRGYAAIVEV